MGTTQRIHGFDIVRGIAVVSMVLFHGCYDLTALRGLDLPWFSGVFEDVWRASISWTFLLLAGWMFTLSRDDLRRAVRYLLVAAGIFIVTELVRVDVPISFGIIFCMGGSTLLFRLLRSAGLRFDRWGWALGFAVAFVLTLGVPSGTFGIGPLTLELPRAPYDSGLLAWLGFPGPGFASGDYYPLIPFALLYGVGLVCGTLVEPGALPHWFRDLRSRPLELIGRHSLLVYVLHQPVLIALLALVPA